MDQGQIYLNPQKMQVQETPQPPPATVSAVLDVDDLLIEILLRVAFPTSLVHAALVCKRWLRLASAPAFLRRFRRLHPPSLLGFYVDTVGTRAPLFVLLPQPPELAAVVRDANFYLSPLRIHSVDVACWNGLVVLASHTYNEPTYRMVSCPLNPADAARDMTIVLQPVPDTSIHGDSCTFTYYHHEILLSRNGDDLSCFCLAIAYRNQKMIVDVYVLRDYIWATYSSAVVSKVPEIQLYKPTLLAGDKIYNLIFPSSNPYKLLLLDLESLCLSLLNLPEQVEPWRVGLSVADDSELHLMHVDVDSYQLRIWLHKMDNNGATTWSLVNTICLREICANHMIPTRVFEDFGDSILTLHAVAGVSSEFAFIEIDSVLYLFDIKRKAAKKVYETTRDKRLCSVIPFMMLWPPNLPSL